MLKQVLILGKVYIGNCEWDELAVESVVDPKKQ